MIDLHTHTTESDGSLTPAELVRSAAAAGISTLAITDHDCTSALAAARAAATETGIRLINGIELSAGWLNRTCHIVGLNIDDKCPMLQQVIATAQQTRVNRGRKIGEALEQAGVEDAWKKTLKLANSHAVTRSHFARMLVKDGKAKDAKQVFKRFMVKGKPGYVVAEWLTMADAITTIHAAGGVAVLAHPARYYLTKKQLANLLDDFAKAQGDAIEVVSGKANHAEITLMAEHANRRNLAASVGSDFHGPDKPWLSLGRLPPLPEKCESVWDRHGIW